MNNLEIVNLLQRITGITALFLITLHIYLGSSKKFLKFHMWNGILAYTFILIHPLLLIVYKYLYISKIDPFYVFTDVCLLCDGKYEYLINFGRLAFYFLTIGVLASYFRNINDWLKINWRKLHILNYFAFYFVSIHSYNIGTDATTKLFLIFFWACQVIVATVIIKKIKSLLI